jgi:hypothetical protein
VIPYSGVKQIPRETVYSIAEGSVATDQR